MPQHSFPNGGFKIASVFAGLSIDHLVPGFQVLRPAAQGNHSAPLMHVPLSMWIVRLSSSSLELLLGRGWSDHDDHGGRPGTVAGRAIARHRLGFPAPVRHRHRGRAEPRVSFAFYVDDPDGNMIQVYWPTGALESYRQPIRISERGKFLETLCISP
jgi:hypothetical protein